uniref:Uncharacterized protein n=2 Tax=Tetranychus urticae TaxID=32264 RepID=T1KH54_TETUR
MTSFDCIKTGRCQNFENLSLQSESSDHHIAKRFAKRLFNRTKKKKPGKNVKNGKKSQPRSEAVKASSTSRSDLRSGKQQKQDNNKAPSAYSNMAQFNLPSDTDIRDLQLHPKVCFMIVCPEQQTIKNVGILDANKRPVQKKPISKAPSFRSASEDHESHDNQKETQSVTSTTVKPTTHKETSTKIPTRPTEKHTAKIMETRHMEFTTPSFTETKAPSSNEPEETKTKSDSNEYYSE